MREEEKVKEMEEFMKQDRASFHKDNIYKMHKMLTEINNSSQATMTKSVFDMYFLDFFRGYTKGREYLASKWEEHAGGPYKTILIKDDLTGETIFEAPSLFPVQNFNLNGAFFDKTANLDKEIKRGFDKEIEKANKGVFRSLIDIVKEVKGNDTLWEDIFRKYYSTNETVIEVDTNNLKDDGLEYEF